MTDKYIIYRVTHRGRIETSFCPFVYFVDLYGPDKTCCWSADISKAKVFNSYEEAKSYDIPKTLHNEWAVDLHPESRYEQI